MSGIKDSFMGIIKRIFFFSIILFCSHHITAQDSLTINGHGCGMHGNAKRKQEFDQNPFKNRWNFPNKADFDTSIALRKLIAKGKDRKRFDQKKAVSIIGYVYDVKPGGIETCNCKLNDARFKDTHIEITPNSTDTAPNKRFIVEVTPRIREKLAGQGTTWTTAELKNSILHHKVQIQGWLFYDFSHEDDSFTYDPHDTVDTGQNHDVKNWRATCWEIHPVTDIKIID